MAGRPGGNPNIREISKKSTGPKTEMGKLKVSMNAAKTLDQAKGLDKAIEETGIKFKKTGEAVALKKMFLSWFKTKSGKELTEIEKLEEVITILEADSTARVMRKLEKGLPLDSSDLKEIRLLKECLTASHELKFGKKNINLSASYNDIREMMFGEKNDNTGSQ